MKKTIKLLSLVLILALALSVPQITAFADTGDNGPVVSASWFCELVGDAGCPSSSDAAVYALVSALRVEGGDTKEYIEKNAPYISITQDGRIYGKAYFVYNKERGYGTAAATLYGYGDFKGVVCANEDDGVSVAQNSDASYDSVFTLSSYDGGMRIRSSVVLDANSAAGLWQQLTGMPVFKDVVPENWFYRNVATAYQKGLVKGKSESYFEPNAHMTYAEAITLAARLHVLLSGENITFATGGNPWYQPYVDYAKANGIPCSFDYNADINRRDFVKIFYSACPESRLAPVKTVADGAIPDVAMNSDSADKIYAFYRAGILSGSDEKGSFLPASKIRRSEVAAIVSRII